MCQCDWDPYDARDGSRACLACGEIVRGEHWMWRGARACGDCKRRIDASRRSSAPASRFLAAGILGVVAASVSALAWAGVAWGAGRSLPMLAILIGWFVGGAVSFGSRDRGGWVYGLMALGLTALAILAGEGSAGLLVGGGAAAGGIDVGGLASLGASRLAALLGDERVTPMLSVVSIPIGLFLAFVESSKGGLGASARLEEWRGPLPPLPDTVSSSG